MIQDNQTIVTLRDLLDYDAQKFTSAEIELKNSLYRWISIASSFKLKTVLQKYLDFVNQHVQKLEAFYETENIVSIALSNRIMAAFLAEAEEKLNNCADPSLKDACLLANIQAINHFKISFYGTAAAFANTLGMESQAAFFHEAEINEKQIDSRLSQLAFYEINKNAITPFELQSSN